MFTKKMKLVPQFIMSVIVVLLLLALALVGCASHSPSPTAVPQDAAAPTLAPTTAAPAPTATFTAIPPTNTPVPPTKTPIPPTATPTEAPATPTPELNEKQKAIQELKNDLEARGDLISWEEYQEMLEKGEVFDLMSHLDGFKYDWDLRLELGGKWMNGEEFTVPEGYYALAPDETILDVLKRAGYEPGDRLPNGLPVYDDYLNFPEIAFSPLPVVFVNDAGESLFIDWTGEVQGYTVNPNNGDLYVLLGTMFEEYVQPIDLANPLPSRVVSVQLLSPDNDIMWTPGETHIDSTGKPDSNTSRGSILSNLQEGAETFPKKGQLLTVSSYTDPKVHGYTISRRVIIEH